MLAVGRRRRRCQRPSWRVTSPIGTARSRAGARSCRCGAPRSRRSPSSPLHVSLGCRRGGPPHRRALPGDHRSDLARYAETRVPMVTASSGVERATWWENVCPGRTDLPRVLDEFSLLGVFEVDDDFRPPDGVRRHHRHPLPAHPAAGAGSADGSPDARTVTRADQPPAAGAGAGAAGLGRLRAHPPHRRGRRARVHDDHALRARRPAATPASCTSTSSTPTTRSPRSSG